MTNPIIVRRLQARIDLAAIVANMADRSIETAHRFRLNAETTFRTIAKSPGIGAPFEADDPDLVGLRCARVARFKNHLIFYKPIENGIEIVRVLHGARDVRTAFESEN